MLDGEVVARRPNFPFEEALLRVAEHRGLEGLVSNRSHTPYRPGECTDRCKVKTAAWREDNLGPTR